jgi:hypothetical protein
VFEPELIRHAPESEEQNLGGLIFGHDLWAALHAQTALPAACLSKGNILADYFTQTSSTLSTGLPIISIQC